MKTKITVLSLLISAGLLLSASAFARGGNGRGPGGDGAGTCPNGNTPGSCPTAENCPGPQGERGQNNPDCSPKRDGSGPQQNPNGTPKRDGSGGPGKRANPSCPQGSK
ncbi:MAG: hypothetical protein HZA31_11625 [Opitutae bacterium]|nr:hypothetical protein [Opitutae bacterium]